MAGSDFVLPRLDPELSVDALRARLAELRAEGVARGLMDEAIQGVASWSWTGGKPTWSGSERAEPFWRERHDLGRPAKEIAGHAPTLPVQLASNRPVNAAMNGKTFREFGRSADGRLLITRLVAEDTTGPWAWHLREIHKDASEVWVSMTESFQSSSSAVFVESVRRTSWQDGRIVASAICRDERRSFPWEAEVYSYRDGQLDAVIAWASRNAGSGQDLHVRYWTVEPGGRKIRARPPNASVPPRLSDSELAALEAEYLDAALAVMLGVIERAWHHVQDEHAATAGTSLPADLAVCAIKVPTVNGGLPFLRGSILLTAAEREALRALATYKPLDAYLKPEGSGLWAVDHDADELLRADSLEAALSEELHRRREDPRFHRLGLELVERLRSVDWASRFPTTDDVLITLVECEGTLKQRGERLERNLGRERFLALREAETASLAARGDHAAAIKLSRAKRTLLAAITSGEPAGRVSVESLCHAFGQFAKVPISRCEPTTDADLVLVEWNTEPDTSHLVLTRQLTPEGPDGEYDGMHVVILDITLPAGALTTCPTGSEWVSPAAAFDSLHTGSAFEAIASAQASEPISWDVTDSPV